MAQTLFLPNFAENNLVGTQVQLTAQANAGASTLVVDNAADFSTAYLLLGTPGDETTELLPNTNVTSGVSIPLISPTILQHLQYEPVQALFANKLKIYRATNVDGSQPADNLFTLLATISIDPTGDSTEYNDAAGGGGFWYKYTYFNSTNNSESDLASATAVRGSFTVNYCSVDEIRREAGFKYAPYVTNDQIDEKRQAAQDEINGALDEFYQTPLQPPINSWLKQITIRLSAGYLRKAQYSQSSDAKLNGQDMIDDAQLDLDKLITKERVLADKQGKSLAGSGSTGGVSGWPNATTNTALPSDGGAPRMFRVSDVQGVALDNNGNPTGANIYYGRRW